MQEITEQGKWSDWISNFGNKNYKHPLDGRCLELELNCEVLYFSGQVRQGRIGIFDWYFDVDYDPIQSYRYWIPEQEETKPETTQTQTQDSEKKHSHYFKDVSNLGYIDVYRVIDLFKIGHPCLQHAVKKLLVSGGRGHKDEDRDIQDVIDSCVRWQEMRKEDKE
jgi:hypothetical protein